MTKISIIQQYIDRQHRLEQKLLESLASPAIPFQPSDWDNIRPQVRLITYNPDRETIDRWIE